MAEKPEDLNLPASAVTRIIKDAIPDGVNISKEAKTAMSRAASVFILYVTTCANTHAIKAKRKTILPNDLFQALADMELGDFESELKESLEAYKKDQKDKKQAAATRKQQKVANEEKSSENAEVIVENDDPVNMECSTDKAVPHSVDGNPSTVSTDNDSAVAVHEPLMQIESSPVVLNS